MRGIVLMAALLLLGCSQQKGLRAIRRSFPGANVAVIPNQYYGFIMIHSGKVYYVHSDGFVQPRELTLDDSRIVQLFDDSISVERP